MNQIRIPLFKTDLSLVRTLRLHKNESIEVYQSDISADIIKNAITDFLSGTNWSLIPETYNIISFIARRRRRGRNRSNNSNIKEHTSKDIDNLLRKINVHFLTFVVNFYNDILKTENIPFFLKQIDTKIKITVNFESFSKLKNSTIGDILKKDISAKYTKYEKSENKVIVEKIENEYQWLSELFNMKYLDLFKLYFNKEAPLEKFKFNEKEFILSTKTKSFYYLLTKKKNCDLKKELVDTAKNNFLYGFTDFYFSTSQPIK
jgi:hypothetical protein